MKNNDTRANRYEKRKPMASVSTNFSTANRYVETETRPLVEQDSESFGSVHAAHRVLLHLR